MLKRLCRETRGAVMVMAAASFTILLLFAGLALDFGRAHLLREQLQTAVDAASLAGALQVLPMVEISIDRSIANDELCKDPVSGKWYPCLSWEPAPPVSLTGPEWDVISNWRAMAGAQCNWRYRCSGYSIVREWPVLPASAVPVAQNTFAANERWPGGDLGPRILDLTVTTNPDRAEVTARATMSVPTTFLKLVGIRELQIVRTGTAVPVKR